MGIGVYIELGGINTLTSPDSIVDLYATFNQAESQNKSDNIKFGLRQRMKSGKTMLNHSQFLGYTKGPDGVLRVVPEEAEIVRKIFDLYVQGNGVRKIKFTMYFVIAGAALTGHPKGSGSFRLSTGEMNPRLISALKGLKKEALLLSPLIWPQSMTTAATRKNGSWQDTTRCCGALSRKKLSVIIHRFPKCRATLSMWITNAVLGGI